MVKRKYDVNNILNNVIFMNCVHLLIWNITKTLSFSIQNCTQCYFQGFINHFLGFLTSDNDILSLLLIPDYTHFSRSRPLCDRSSITRLTIS